MPITLELPCELEEKLDSLVKDTGKTREDYLVAALEEYLEALEDYNDAVRITDDIKSGRMRTWTSKEVNEDLGLDA